MRSRFTIAGLAVTAVAIWLGASAAHAGGVLTVAMTAGDIPVTTGTPDQGAEGLADAVRQEQRLSCHCG